MKISAIMLAAGLSSRMGEFKPLLPFGKKRNGQDRCLIEASVECLKNAGVDDIVCVLGKRADELRSILDAYDVKSIENFHYADTKMFDSFKLGFDEIYENADAFFVLPADMPLIRANSLKCLMEKAGELSYVDALIPCFARKNGHPPLIMKSAYESIIAHDGKNGLRGILGGLRKEYLHLPDKGILLDCDTKQDYLRNIAHLDRYQIPSWQECFEIWRYYNVREDIRAHQMAVARLAVETAKKLNAVAGYDLDLALIEAAAFLHDIAKKEKKHAKAAAEILREWEFYGIADTVECHTDLPDDEPALNERTILYWADKRVHGSDLCTINERFDCKLKGKEIKPRIARRRIISEKIEMMIESELRANDHMFF